MKVNHVWIVEMLKNGNWTPRVEGEWVPTVGCYLSREEARRNKIYDWEHNCPLDKFRIRKYVCQNK